MVDRLAVRLRKRVHALILQLLGDSGHVDPIRRELGEDASRSIDVFLQGQIHSAVVAKRLERRDRHRVDRRRADELLDVQRVAVARVLRRCARPQASLHGRAGVAQGIPAGTRVQLAEYLVCELGVRDRRLAQETANLAVCRLHLLLQQRVDFGVDPADEETGHAVNAAQVASARAELIEPGEKRFHHLDVTLHREDQRDVDVCAFGDHRLDRRQSGGRGRDLHHHVGT